ncbi:hypothetical protein F5880DRAFT_157722 [Lentinula raphanica]|nr:hypothetical protein F5880DRAFT_157722 [Lentinula raphanica]
MVSFQCHACNDVVKKPKLDQHRNRCHSGFDCIDCSKTFHTPAEYKNHTSCISEAEKYEKTLYKGPKKGQNDYSAPQRNGSFRGNGRGRGRGGGFGNTWERRAYTGTGANDTPLGTPRYSPSEPVVKIHDDPPQQSAAVVLNATVTEKVLLETKAEVKEKKKEKKRKAIGSEDVQVCIPILSI